MCLGEVDGEEALGKFYSASIRLLGLYTQLLGLYVLMELRSQCINHLFPVLMQGQTSPRGARDAVLAI